MADKVIGVDFGGSGIKIAEIQTGKEITVLRQILVPLDRDVVHNGAVAPENISLVASVLKSALAEHKVLTRDAIMGINSVADVFVNRTVTDWHDPKDFHRAITFDLAANQHLLPGAPEEIMLDAVIHRDFTDEDGNKKLDALLVGVVPEVVDIQVQILQKAGLNVAGADLGGIAMLRAVETFVREEGQLDLLVDVGAEVVSVLIHENGRPYALNLYKSAGGRDADRVIEQAIQNDNRKVIESIKSAAVEDQAIFEALSDYTLRVYNAIEKSVANYLAAHPPTTRRPPIEAITLTGAGALLPTLDATLSNSFRVPVQIARLDPAIAGDAAPFLQEGTMSTSFTAAIGLAMGVAV